MEMSNEGGTSCESKKSCGGDPGASRGTKDDEEKSIPKLPLLEWEGGQERAREAMAAFTQAFGSPPEFHVRVPGR